MKYAAGGQEDRVERNYQPSSGGGIPLILKILVIALIALLLIPSLSTGSLKATVKSSIYDQLTKTYKFSYEVKNTSFGLILNPEHTLNVTDQKGKLI